MSGRTHIFTTFFFPNAAHAFTSLAETDKRRLAEIPVSHFIHEASDRK